MGVSASAWADLTIPGNFNNWDHTGAFIQNSGTSSYSIYLNAGTYDFQINDRNDNGTLYGTNGATMYRDNCTDWKLGNKNSICKINADVSGTYTFHYIGWDNGPKISVTYPAAVSNEIGFFTNEAWNIKIGEHWQKQEGYGATGNPTEISLNTTITSGISIGFWAQTYKKGNTNVCSPRVYVKIEDESGKVIQDYKYYELPNSSTTTDNNTGSTNQLWLSDNVQTIPALTDGKYRLKVYFEMWGNKSGTSGCNQYDMFLNNGGGNYVFPFTIAGGGTGDGGDDVEGCTTVYLNNELKLWDTTNNHAYIYHWGSSASSSWKVMLPSSCNNGGIWYASIPNDVAGYKFVLVDDVHGEPTWNDRIYQTQDLSLGNQHQYKITKVTQNSADAQGEYQAPTCTDKDPNCSGGGGGGGDDPDDPVLSDCDYIEVWCRYEDGKTNMHCYAWDADKNNLLGGWPGVTSNVTDTYEGKTYAIWKFSNVDNINIIFNNNSGGQTADITGHIKGNVYYYTLKDWNYDQTHKKLDCSLEPTDVLLAREAYLDPATKEATVYGYLKATDCKDITDYGFYYCTTLDGATPCIPVANNNLKWSAIGSGNTPLPRGMEFSAKTGILENGLTYYYRAYAVVGEETILSQEVRSISTEPCVAQTCCGDPVIYTVDATFTSDNPCKLYFRDVQKAIDHLKGSYASEPDFRYVTVEDGSYNLNQPVVINVRYHDDSPNDPSSAYLYRGTTSVGKRSGDAMPVNSNLIRDINKTATNRANTLTIKAGNSIAKPWLHHIVIRNSKNIVLDSLCIYSDPNGVGDNAIEMDINVADAGGGWNEAIAKGFFTDANILVQNCMIGSDGFTGAHLSNYDGVTFKNNDFEIVAADGTDPDWGASLKLLYCKNIKFIENNFRGDHATLMWIQEVENMLVMNNVFWNTNKFTVGANDQFPAAMRLVAQFGNPVDNIGIFYNTYYFAENDVVASASGYDFLQFTHTIANGGHGDIDLSTIQFKYNNCYSYDKDAPGRSNNTKAFLGNDLSNNKNFCPNNFWSEYDVINPPKDGKSAFAFGCGDNKFINVKGQVCATTASGPASLIISGDAMNLGVAPDVSFTGIKLEADELLADRYLDGVRPSNGEGWTYGAYQQRESKDVEKIYWVGVSNKWDDRNNWEFETENNGKIVRQRVSCVENLSENLHVVIEEIGTVEVAGGRKWPRVPSSFDATDRQNESKVKDGDIGVPEREQVNAGNSGKYASYIELEYGAGIIGVENLVKTIGGNKVAYYDSASTQFVSPRSEWILVGPTVKPFATDENGNRIIDADGNNQTRNLLSGDYFIKNQEPHVYMHRALVDGEGTVSWDLTFTDLTDSLKHDEVYAMQIPDEYGPFKLPAELHFAYISPNPSMVKDATVSKDYAFRGRFYNEKALPTYTGLSEGDWVLISNTYPANIDAYELDNSGLGKVQIYDYEAKSFGTLKAKSSTPILSQHGFVFQPASSDDLVIPVEYFLNTLTRRSATIVDPYCRINVKNITSNASSDVEIEIDELKDDVANYGTDASKVFNSMEASLPDMYIKRYGKKWAEVTIPTMSEAIPLGIRISQTGTTIRFSYVDSEGLGDVILEDRLTGETYNLSIGQVCTVSDLPVGDCEGRFFLNLSEKDMEDNEDVDDDVTTDVEESSADSGISIIALENSVLVSCSTDMELQYIYINDMSGKTAMYKVSGQYIKIDMPVAQGVYTVNVITDKANKTGKVILK